MDDHEYYMKLCTDLALKSLETGDLPFGAVLVRNHQVVSTGLNTGLTDITGHAEINAIKNFLECNNKSGLRECALYTNFEPCAMCSFIIRDYGLKQVVYSVSSPHLGGHTRWNILTSKLREPFTSQGIYSGPEVIGGILAKENSDIFDKLNWKMHYFE